MTFASPGLLAAGLACAALPVLLHLLMRRRRAPVKWAAMDILREAIRRTDRRRRIERWLLLAARCVTVAAIGAAIADPLWRSGGGPAAGTAGSIDLVIVLDDGVAQRSDAGGTTALERSLASARRLLDELSPGDRAALILAAAGEPGPRRAAWPPTADLARVRDLLGAVVPMPWPSRIPEAARMGLAREGPPEAPDAARRRAIVICSEGRAGSWSGVGEAAGGDAGRDPSSNAAVLVSVPSMQPCANVAITEVEALPRGPATPEGTHAVRVWLSRSAEAARSGTQEIDLDAGVARARAAVAWQDGQREASVDMSLSIPAGTSGADAVGHGVAASIAAGDAQPADDVRHAVIGAARPITVLLLDEAGGSQAAGSVESESPRRWVERALRPVDDADVDIERVDPSTLSRVRLRGADAAVALRPDLIDDAGAQALGEFVRAGGTLIVVPPHGAGAAPWADRVLRACSVAWTASREPREMPEGEALATDQPASALLRQVAPELRDLVAPVTVTRMHTLEIPAGSGEVLLSMRDGAPLAASAPVGRGTLVVLAAAPELSWTTMPVKPIMVPFLQEIVRQGMAMASSARRVQAGSMRIDPPSTAFPGGTLSVGEGAWVLAVSPDGTLSEPIASTGIATLADSSGNPAALMAVRIDPASASCEPGDPSVISGALAAATRAQVRAMDAGDLPGALASWRASGTSGAAAGVEAEPPSGQSMAWIAFVAALGLALVEMTLARRASHAPVRSAARGAS